MHTTLNIHSVKSIEIGPAARLDTAHEAYSCTVSIQDEDGSVFELSLFARDAKNLVAALPAGDNAAPSNVSVIGA